MNRQIFIDVDLGELTRVGEELGASTPQFKKALWRASVRTAATLKTLASRGLKNELQLRTISLLRKRLRIKGRTHQFGDPELWIGANDIPVSWFKGRPRKTKDGAEHKGQGFKGGFIAKSNFKGRRTIFKRTGADRLPIAEQNMPVSGQVFDFLDGEIMAKAADIYWKHFMRDLKARVAFEIGEK